MFTNVLLADEVNRTPPKTQAALLEAMQERQVSVEGRPEPLPDPFLVVATQNPIEYEGTYPLPEAQLDRFLVKLDVGYPSAEEELGMLALARRGVGAGDLDEVQPVAGADALRGRAARSTPRAWSEEVARYVVDVVRRTRELPSVELGACPRAAVHLLGAARAAARLAGRDYVTPDDVSRMAAARAAPPARAHARGRARALRPRRRRAHRARRRPGAAVSPSSPPTRRRGRRLRWPFAARRCSRSSPSPRSSSAGVGCSPRSRSPPRRVVDALAVARPAAHRARAAADPRPRRRRRR